MTAPSEPGKQADLAAIDLLGSREILDHDGYLPVREALGLITAVEALRGQLEEYDTLFDLSAERERPWIEAWRQDTGKHGTLPDYGKLLAWLCERAEAAEARADELAGALIELSDLAPWGGTDFAAFTKWVQGTASTALAATPAEALERARALWQFIDDFESQFVCWGMMHLKEQDEAVQRFVERAAALDRLAQGDAT